MLRRLLILLFRVPASNFDSSLRDPKRAQSQLLSRILKDLAQTQYGQLYGIEGNETYSQYAKKVPLVTYEGLEPFIQRQQKERTACLTTKNPIHYEPTSGSSGKKKTIPYNLPLLRSFSRMFAVWCYDLLIHIDQLSLKRFYISISPAFQTEAPQTETEGFEEDSQYLPKWLRFLLNKRMVHTPGLKTIKSTQDYYHALACVLLCEPTLQVLSFWSPSLLRLLVGYIQENKEKVIDSLRTEIFISECGVTMTFNGKLQAERIAQAQSPSQWWPNLQLISCWGSAWAKQDFKQLKELFPNVTLQAKGLLATEAPITIPSIEADGFVPLVNEVFLEFIDRDGKVFRLEQLETGCEYEVVVTNQGGLYRYQMGDRIRVTHFFDETPCLEFIGRTSESCDLVGEKMNQRFVESCLKAAFSSVPFCLLVPDVTATPASYCLFYNGVPVEVDLESHLMGSFHYRQARKMGQLSQCRTQYVENLELSYYSYFQNTGMRIGDIKTQTLISSPIHSNKLIELLNEAR